MEEDRLQALTGIDDGGLKAEDGQPDNTYLTDN
jgi:hypothetical protein